MIDRFKITERTKGAERAKIAKEKEHPRYKRVRAEIEGVLSWADHDKFMNRLYLWVSKTYGGVDKCGNLKAFLYFQDLNQVQWLHLVSKKDGLSRLEKFINTFQTQIPEGQKRLASDDEVTLLRMENEADGYSRARQAAVRMHDPHYLTGKTWVESEDVPC